ncbi:ABC transporter ATP-binding protein/permease [Pseudomonas peli]|uniref:ABC transporter ATP-binding protein/permease n=1 Tax=Pseudomonas peli TaxID=592361 RepID=UPI0024AC96E8|nr:ABC transporter ATP-binding protein/permease [Pseudomonas peli]
MKLLRNFLRLVGPYWLDRRNWQSWLLLASIIGLGLGIVQINVRINAWSKTFYDTLGEFDTDALYGLMGEYSLYIGIFVLIAVYKAWLRKALLLRWRQSMSERLIGDWLQGQAYYRLGLEGEPDNPDQRIAEDVNLLVTRSVDLLVSFIINVAQVTAFVGILWALSGTHEFELFGYRWQVEGYLVWIAVIYTLVGTLVTHWLGRPLHRLNYAQQSREADFRADLLRKRDHAEQIALYRGEEAERQQLRVRFQAIAENWWRLMVRERNLGFFVVGYDRVSNIIPIFAALPLFLAKTITLGGLMQVRTAFSAVQGSLSWFIGAYTTLAEWSATVERLGQFEEAIVRTRQQVREPLCGDCLCLDRLDVLLPNGEPLMCDLRGQVQHGEWVRLAGPSGMGKSTLLRTLQGLWPYYRGAWQLPNGRSLLLPQKPYLAALPLRELLVYPSADMVADQRLREVLEQVGLPQLACQLERQTEWERELSGGEQQRLGLARALLFQPHTLYLDEATNQLDDRAAQSLLAMLRRELPQCTVIGVSHQERVQALFDRSLELNAQRGELAAAVPKGGR